MTSKNYSARGSVAEECRDSIESSRSSPSQMRICLLANASSPHSAKWVNYFCAKGHEVHVVSFEDPLGITPKAVIHKLRTGKASNLRYFTVTDQLKSIVAKVQPDLLHAHYAAGYGILGRFAQFHPHHLLMCG